MGLTEITQNIDELYQKFSLIKFSLG